MIDKSMLDYEQYLTFLEVRSAKMLDRIQKKLGFSNTDFAINQKAAAAS